MFGRLRKSKRFSKGRKTESFSSKKKIIKQVRPKRERSFPQVEKSKRFLNVRKQKFPQVKAEMTTKQKILFLLAKKPEGMRPFELSKVLKLTRSTVSEHLQDLTKQKRVRYKGTHKVRYYYLR